MLFKMYEFVLEHTSNAIWRQLFQSVLKSILEDIDCNIDPSKTAIFERSKDITGLILKHVITLLSKYSTKDNLKFELLVQLYLEVVKEFISNSWESPLG